MAAANGREARKNRPAEPVERRAEYRRQARVSREERQARYAHAPPFYRSGAARAQPASRPARFSRSVYEQCLSVRRAAVQPMRKASGDPMARWRR